MGNENVQAAEDLKEVEDAEKIKPLEEKAEQWSLKAADLMFGGQGQFV